MKLLWTFYGTNPIYANVPIYAATGQIICYSQQIVGWSGYNVYPTPDPPAQKEK